MQPNIRVDSQSLARKFGEMLVGLNGFQERQETRYAHLMFMRL